MLRIVCMYCQTTVRTIVSEDVTDRASHGICPDCLPFIVRDLGLSMEEFLDTLSAPVLVVQDEGRVLAANAAARALLSKPQEQISGCLGGEVISCRHAYEAGGCGQTIHCESCAIRRTVMRTMETGEPQLRVPAYADIGDLSGDRKVRFLISTEKRGGCVLLRIDEVGNAAEDPVADGF